MLCQKGSKTLLEDKDYLFQPKLDGTRAIYQQGRLINRRGRNIEQRYPEFNSFKIQENTVLDGEIIVYNDKGLPDFNLLQSREQTSKKFKIELLSMKHPATYVVFDCLTYEGQEITKEPIEKRLGFLKQAIQENNNLQLIFTTEKGQELWNKIDELGQEGVIAKKKGSTYQPGKRSDSWLKIKNLKTIDCVIQGYTKGEGRREETFGAMIIGIYNEDHQLSRIGKVGTGWTDKELINLKKEMGKYVIEEKEDHVILKPKLVCEVEYLEFTKNQDLRAPSFKRMRYDKPPEECTFEQIES